MVRYDLAFFLCCCKSFLGSADDNHGENFYALLGVDRDASPEDIKKAYKKQSLQMHPDKLAQRGKKVTPEDQAKFTRMKEAYEVLSDQHKRETYDAIGERGMKWIEEPFSMDPQELAHNFAKSSALDRSKIFGIFVAAAIAVLLLPILICLHVDGAFGVHASWLATLTPLWMWDCFILFYHSRVILMGPIQRPEHVPPEEWIDPLPMKKRYFSLARFILIVVFELLVALRLDGVVTIDWAFIFIPMYIWELTTLYKKWPLARMRIVTVEDLETALGKRFSEFTPAEKELIGKRYSVVPSTTSPDFEAAQKLKARARHDMIKSGFRIVFVILLLIQIDGYITWNWWLIFTPFWLMTFLICYANYQSFAEVQQMAAEKDPALFGPKKDANGPASNYGSVGNNGEATPQATAKPELTEEEREELKAQVMASGSRLCSKCCSQGFLLVLMFLFVGKLQGAGFSSLWIISPFLFGAGLILCCLGLAIFGITEVPTDGVEFDTGEFAGDNADVMGGPPAAPPGTNYAPPPAAEQQSSSEAEPDPEQGECSVRASPVVVAQTPETSLDNPSDEKDQTTRSGTTAKAAPRLVDLLDDYVKPGNQDPGALHDLD